PVPLPLPALRALAGVFAILAVAEVVVFQTRPAALPRVLGFGRPRARALAVAAVVGLAVAGGGVVAAGALGATLRLRPDWPAVLPGVFLFHGLGEELVWRGFAFRHLRTGRTFRRAVLLSMPLIALTHVPVVLGSGVAVGLAAMVVAALTCLPFAYL